MPRGQDVIHGERALPFPFLTIPYACTRVPMPPRLSRLECPESSRASQEWRVDILRNPASIPGRSIRDPRPGSSRSRLGSDVGRCSNEGPTMTLRANRSRRHSGPCDWAMTNGACAAGALEAAHCNGARTAQSCGVEITCRTHQKRCIARMLDDHQVRPDKKSGGGYGSEMLARTASMCHNVE
jgi:hypothetical protein